MKSKGVALLCYIDETLFWISVLTIETSMNHRTIISSKRDCYIELLNFDMDPNVWFVRRFKKVFLFKRQISSDRFIDGNQARAFAVRMEKECMRVRR